MLARVSSTTGRFMGGNAEPNGPQSGSGQVQGQGPSWRGKVVALTVGMAPHPPLVRIPFLCVSVKGWGAYVVTTHLSTLLHSTAASAGAPFLR